MLISSIAAIIAGLALLVWSADRFVHGAAAIASNLGVSSLVIGITIVGFGTSAPELLISAMASLDAQPDLAIGNAIGSNIANIAMILGVTALIIPLNVESQTLKREFPLLLGIMVLTWWLLSDGVLDEVNGLVLLTGLLIVMGWLIYDALHARRDDPMIHEIEEEYPTGVPIGKAIFWFLIGLMVLLVSSKMLVWGAINIAQMIGVSDLVIGLTIVAIGTSLPELAASIASAMKKEADLAVGNVIGSNIFNTLGVLALPGLIHPSILESDIMKRDLPIMVGLTALLFLMAYGFRSSRRKINRIEGGFLLACFIAYQGLIFWSVQQA